MKIVDFLRSPIFVDDEKHRVASALQGILKIILIALGFVLIVLYAAGFAEALMGIFYGLGTVLITWILVKYKKIQLASLFFLCAAVLVLNYFMLVGQGIHDIVIIALPLILIMAGLLLERKAFLVLAVLMILSTNLVIYAELQGWVDTGFNQITTFADILIVTIILITVVLIVRMLSDNLLDSLVRTREYNEQQARLILESRSQAEQLRILNQISSAIAAGLDLDRILEGLYQQLRLIVPLDSFYVAMIDHRLGLVTFPIFYSSGQKIMIAPESLDAGSGLTGEVIRTQKTLYVPDVTDRAAQEEHEIIAVGPGETCSYVGLPLHLHGEVFGVMSVQCRLPHAYIQEQLRLLETITSQASVAIDNARLFVEVSGALKREEHLNEVSRVISGTLDLQFILENIVRLTVELMEADAGYLSLVSADFQELTHVYDYKLPPDVNDAKLPKGQGLTWWVIENLQSVSVREISQDQRADPALKNSGFHAVAGAPILAGDECLGMMSALSSNPMQVFLERDLETLEAIGRLAGSAIRNARLFSALQQELNERRRIENALQQRDTVLEAVAYAAETFLKAPDWRDGINSVLKRLCDEIGASHSYIYQAERGEKGRLLFSIIYEHVSEDGWGDLGNLNSIHAPAENLGSKRWLYSMLRGEPYFGNLSTLPPEDAELMSYFHVQSFLDVPILVGSEFWGVIGFEDSIHERAWSESEVDSLKVAASVLGAAIQRQRSDGAIRKLNAELEQRVLDRTAELQIANRELESFAYSVSHDLRTPLRGIDGYSRLLQEDYYKVLDEQGRQYLDNVHRATSQMGLLIDDLLKLSRVSRAEMHREVISLTNLTTEITEALRQRDPGRNVEILIEPNMQVFGDASLMKLALENMVNNAWKFTSRNPNARIEIASTNDKGRAIYYVRDNGVGFDMKYKDKLFTAFQRLHNAEDFEGTGVGLATVQRVIQRHSGHIWAEGQVDQGATFFFTLFDSGSND